MIVKTRISGIPKVKRNLEKLRDKMVMGAKQGLEEGAVLLKEISVSKSPRYTGNLRNSSYVVVAGKGEVSPNFRAYMHATSREIANFEAVRARAIQAAGIRVNSKKKGYAIEVGFGAEYALKVHEAVGRNFKIGGPLFLANTLKSVGSQIVGKILNLVKL